MTKINPLARPSASNDLIKLEQLTSRPSARRKGPLAEVSPKTSARAVNASGNNCNYDNCQPEAAPLPVSEMFIVLPGALIIIWTRTTRLISRRQWNKVNRRSLFKRPDKNEFVARLNRTGWTGGPLPAAAILPVNPKLGRDRVGEPQRAKRGPRRRIIIIVIVQSGMGLIQWRE